MGSLLRCRWFARGAGVLALIGIVVVGAILFNQPGEVLESGSERSAVQRSPGVPDGPVRPAPPSQDYVGSAVCAECHSEVIAEFAQHPMGMSLAEVGAEEVIEDYHGNRTFRVPPSPRSRLTFEYSARRGEQGVHHHETAFDSLGEVVYDQGEPVHYAVGSGQRGRSYLTNRGGLLFMSPITWYSEKGGWNLSPGYNVGNLRFERRIVDGCVGCHAGRLDVQPGRPNCYAPSPFVEKSIGCERCHGPGGPHVRHHRLEAAAGAADPIVNPTRLTPSRRDDVCLQCHLVGESRITRYGRTDFDFRPGDSLDETWTVFVLGTGVTADRTTAAVSQAEQMLSSECFRRSNGEMGCTSCHDPHSIPRPEGRIQFFRSRCLQCHDSRAAECALPRERRVEVTIEDSCIDCHMPRISANDVPHTSQTDHRVLLDPTASGSAAVETTAPELTVFRGERQPLSAAELDRAWGITMMRDAERRSDRILAYHAIPKLRSWCNKAPDDAPACEALGLAYWLNRDPGSAQAVWERALEYHPREEQLLKRLVEILHENGRFTEGIEYSRQLIALNPWQHEYHGRLAHMLGQQRRFDEAIAAAEMALRINPTAASVHAWLAEVYALRGDAVRSQWHQQQYELLTPVR